MPKPLIPALPTLIRQAILDPDPPSGRSDLPFIVSSWVNDQWQRGRGLPRAHRKSIFFEEIRPLVRRLFREADVLVACNLENPEQIYGWCCFTNTLPGVTPLLHYCYVKLIFRRQGVAEKLLKIALEDKPALFTHRTELSDLYLGRWRSDYNLYRAFGGPDGNDSPP